MLGGYPTAIQFLALSQMRLCWVGFCWRWPAMSCGDVAAYAEQSSSGQSGGRFPHRTGIIRQLEGCTMSLRHIGQEERLGFCRQASFLARRSDE